MKYVFSQVTSFLPSHVFENCTKRYNGNHWVHRFSCWNQLLCMMFGQLSGRDSLRDLIISLNAHIPKFYHLGIGKSISKSNLAHANEKRDYRIFEDYAYYLIREARNSSVIDDDFLKAFEGPVYAFDSTIIDLCLTVFWWATYKHTRGGVKLHTQLDIKTNIPCFVHLTPAGVNDMRGLDEINYEKNGFYILDRGYIDYNRLRTIHLHDAFFIVRAKDNLRFDRQSSNKCNKAANIRCDQIIKLHGYYSSHRHPEKLRRVKFFDKETANTFVFLTNNMQLKAEEIAALYKYRWKIELFFKWIKQHLKIKSFWGTSQNAVKIQVYVALICFAVVTIIKNKLKTEKSTYEILQILSVSLLDKTPLKELLTNHVYQDVKEQNCNQLNIFKFI
jgi:hypothetical protein